jgi:hypothetical protein
MRLIVPGALCIAALAADPATPAQEATVPPVPVGFSFDGRAAEWLDRPVTFGLLPTGAGAPGGRLWLGTADDGLVIAGEVTGAVPRWAAAPGDMAAGDHVEVWLADGDTLVVPPIGWGNQFADQTLASADACATVLGEPGDSAGVARCRAWYGAQERYRQAFRRLFVRQWQLAPNVAVETFAQPAYEALDDSARARVAPLKPSAMPTMRATSTPPGYQFEVLIPWTAFPPLRSLRVARLRAMVDVFRPGAGGRRYGAFATTAFNRRWGDAATFNSIVLAAPREYVVTACTYPLRGYRARTSQYFGYSHVSRPDTMPTYFVPTASHEVQSIIGLENEARGYAYEPAGRSPIATTTTFFSRPLSGGGRVCGPPVRFLDGDVAQRVDTLTLDSAFQWKRLPDGTYLLRSGPRVMNSFYGSGQCGACPRVGLTMLHLDPRGGVMPALEFFDISEPEFHELDVAVSATWDSVYVWRQRVVGDDPRSLWSLTIQCWDPGRGAFAVCAERDSVPEPTPRHLVYY